MPSTTTVEKCFKMMGGKLSLPIPLEGSMEMKAEQVSSIEMDKEQRAFSGNNILMNLGTECVS